MSVRVRFPDFLPHVYFLGPTITGLAGDKAKNHRLEGLSWARIRSELIKVKMLERTIWLYGHCKKKKNGNHEDML